MALKIITISDGFESSSVPAINLPSIERVQTFHYTLTGTDIINGYVTLPTTTIFPTETVLMWNGINQRYGTDFNCSTNKVFFLAGLSSFLLPSDNVTIIFS
jgi:hypothetical protein